MNRRNRVTGPSLLLAALSGGLLAGCGSAARPKALVDATGMINRSETRKLESLRPRLIQEAKGFLEEADRAYRRGDVEEAKLYAHLALQRYATAKNYVDRDSAKRLAGVMEESRREALERQEELERYEELDERIGKLGAAIDSSKGDERARSAKRALVDARRKQAEAIGAGAPTVAPDKYQEGKSLIETSIESLEMGMFGESEQSSSRALGSFESAIVEARSKKAGRAAAEAARAAAPAPATADRGRAEAAITDASTARAAAIASRMPDERPDEYARGTSLLTSAERRFDAGDFAGALKLANEATAALRGSGGKASPLGSARQAVREAEDARADAISRGGSDDAQMPRADFALDTARRALTDRDDERARDKAREARGLYAQIGGATPAATARPPRPAGSMHEVAEKKLVELRFRRGELLGANRDQTCRGPFREFEAILELAEKRLDARDAVQAYEFGVRAEERLRKCDQAPPSASEARDDIKQDAARKKAAVALQKAQAAYAKTEAKLGTKPELAQPKQLLGNAERWYERGDYEQTETLANLATSLLTDLDRAPKKPAAEAADPARKLAEKSLADAQQALAKARAKLGDDARLESPKQLIAAAERWYEREAWDRSKELSGEALASLKGMDSAQRPVAKGGSKVDACADGARLVKEARELDRKVDAQRMTLKQKADREQARSLVNVAQKRLTEKQCERGLELGKEAHALALGLPAGDGKGAPTAAKPATKPAVAKAAISKGAPGLSAEGGAAWQRAYDRAEEALKLRERARPRVTEANRANFASADAALGASRASYRSKDWIDAERQATRAIAGFEAVLAGKSAPATEAAGGEDVGERAKAVVQGYEQRAGAAAPSGWKQGYAAVIDALTLRDRAKDAAQSEDEDAVKRGMEHIERSRAAWQSKNYFAAGKFADSAKREFASVIEAVEARKSIPERTQPPSDAADPQAFELADEALRAAKVMLAVCEREGCAERDFAEFTAGKQAVTGASESFDERKYAYAEKLARDAKKRLAAVLDKPKPGAAQPAVDPALAAKQRQAADDAVREANVAQKLCEAKGCDRTDYEEWLRSEQQLSAARAAFVDADYVRAAELAGRAEKSMRKVLAIKPAFVIPEGAGSISRQGDRLLLAPAIDFRTASALMTPASGPPVHALAKVLIANREAIKSVRLIGHTDSQGNAAKNRQLSAARAAAILNTLVAAGVPRGLLTAEGRGPDEPVADNASAEGRAANRRVEVRMELKK